MRRWKCVYIVIAGLLLLMAPASALVPDGVEINTSSEWLTAGSGDTATITVLVTNGSTPIPGAAVAFAVEGAPGSISPAIITTNSAGRVTAVFSPATASGTATITATVSHEELVAPLIRSVDQQIDHAAPDAVTGVWYDPVVTVGGTTKITVRMADCYGNVVDGRNTAETVQFSVGSPSGSAAFVGGTDRVARPADAAGNATVTLCVDTLPGENIVKVSPPAPLPERYLTISGAGNGEPCAIMVDVRPGGDPPITIADGVSSFVLIYTLLDEYGNPTWGQELSITTNVSGEEEIVLPTNGYGQVLVSYGPREAIGGVTVTATAVENVSVTCSQDLVFVSNEPKNLLLSTCPETMPSRDVPGSVPAVIRAKVVDLNGNPVAGETVSFSIRDIVVGEFNQTAPPSLSTSSATTDEYGIASAEFIPGTFTTDFLAPGYSPAATGTCVAVATWNGIERPVTLTWMNYPYLSVETGVTPETVTVNDTVDVTIRLRGDGWALKPTPLDVVLCMDRGARMVSGYPDHMVTVMEAAPIFIDQMIPRWDRVGLISFGANKTVRIDSNKHVCTLGPPNTELIGVDNSASDDAGYIAMHYPGPDGTGERYYTDHATLDVPLTDTAFADVRAGIAALLPSGGNPIRKGLYESIKTLRDDGRPGAIKAVVVLGDSKYSWYGDPLADGNAQNKDPESIGQQTKGWYEFTDLSREDQNMSVFARNCNVSIYAITYSPDDSTFMDENMRILAEGSGGKYYKASTKEDLIKVYEQIADDLKTEAGVNTTMDVTFENVEVDSTPVAGDQVFDYVHAMDVSTLIRSYNSTTEIIPAYTRDDTAAWDENQTLHFDIGTIHLNETWEATFRLKVLAEGTISLFGDGATITFNDHDHVSLPRVYVTAFGEENTTLDSRALSVSDLNCTGPATEFIFLTWNLNYTGTFEAAQEISCSGDNGYTWVRLATLHSPPGARLVETSLDVRGLPPGDYNVRVYATAPDAPDAWQICGPIQVGDRQKDYIRLQ